MEKSYQLRFYTPAYEESKEGGVFGCASFGVCNEKKWHEPAESVNLAFGKTLKGILINASLAEAREQITVIPNKADVKAGIVLYGNCGRENEFTNFLCTQLPDVPLIGGSSAFTDNGKKGRLLPENNEFSALFLTDEKYSYFTEYCNIHSEIIKELSVEGTEPRHIKTVIDAGKRVILSEVIREIGLQKGIMAGLHERVAVSDQYNRNIHLIPDGENYICGADLPENRQIFVRYSCEDAFEEIRQFYSCENALIFGCAGLKSILDNKTFVTGRNTLGLFMFGEVVPIGKYSNFANLTLARLQIVPK
jgi:hypothetical protein